MEPDLREMLAAWMGRDLDPTEADRLLARLRDDSDFRLAFVAEIRMLGMLKAVQSSEPRWLRLEDELGWSARRAPDEGSSAVEEEFARRLADALPQPIEITRRGAWLKRVAAAAAVLVGVALVYSIAARREEAPSTLPPASVVASGRPLSSPPPAVAMVLQADSARWGEVDGPPPVVGEVLHSRRLELLEGRATLSMLNGVRLVVEGPADLDLISVDQVHCRRGRLRAHVPEGAEGFIVSGPGSAVVDMGTEFALNLAPEDAARGRVIQGKVEAAVLGPSGTLERSRVLTEQRSFKIGRSVVELEGEDDSPADFVGPSNLAADTLAPAADYAAAVLADHPESYWRFERMDSGRIPNEVSGGPDLVAHGPVRLAGPADGRGNRCAEFPGGDTNQYFSPTTLWSPPDRPGYAVELWFLTEWISHAALAAMVSEPDTQKHAFLLELTSRNRLTLLYKPASVRMVHRRPPGQGGGGTVFSEPFYIPYHWHHLVGQMNGDRMEVYLDGRPTISSVVSPGPSTPPVQFILGRLTTIPIHDPGYSRPFHGRIDETAIYSHPLTPERILLHHELGRGRH